MIRDFQQLVREFEALWHARPPSQPLHRAEQSEVEQLLADAFPGDTLRQAKFLNAWRFHFAVSCPAALARSLFACAGNARGAVQVLG